MFGNSSVHFVIAIFMLKFKVSGVLRLHVLSLCVVKLLSCNMTIVLHFRFLRH